MVASLAAATVKAGCENATLDSCLVGTWKQTGGGPEEWMREHMKTVQVHIDTGDVTMTLNEDGTYETSKARSKTEISVEGTPVEATGNMSMQGSGKWSAADDALTFCAMSFEGDGALEVMGPSGREMTMKLPKIAPEDSVVTYTCVGDTLTTVMEMMDSKMTTIFTRVP